ncbi:MXAN_6640 family putative metalloprotease [Nocardioides sp. CCNWLW239]|uniref:MXAN_6640 family putative metalloprotease n=1 Tax=Nocardioides sp. CCNWLW239 TaxID=3128902 RepID=UPI0030195D5E
MRNIARRITRKQRSLVLIAGMVVATFVATMPATGSTPATSAVTGGEASAEQPVTEETAREALAEAKKIKRNQSVRGVRQVVPGRHVAGRPDATIALTNLWNAKDALDGSDKTAARELLARPRATSQTCSTAVCVHYTPGSGGDRASVAYATQVRDVVTKVHNLYVQAGYRKPAADKAVTPGKVDIYLENLYDEGYYGYCAPESKVSKTAATAYCVLDNNYASSEYGYYNTPTENLRVTAAHEYFHAVQFAYDAGEDRWMMESTATWVEDEVYDSIDDNRQYLAYGQLEDQRKPLDNSNASNLGIYGNWIFFRFLSERYARERGQLPAVVLDIWRRAESTYSTLAIRRALADRGTTLKTQYTRFAAGNLAPRKTYSEGRAYYAPVYDGRTALPAKRQTVDGKFTLKHLTYASQRLVPKKVGKGWKLRVKVDVARPNANAAVVSVFRTDGTRGVYYLKPNRDGIATKTIEGFSSKRIRKVEVTFANASSNFRCGQGTAYSCRGIASPDKATHRWWAKTYR